MCGVRRYVPPCLRWLKRARASGAALGSGTAAVLHPPDIGLVTALLRYLGDFLGEYPQFTKKEAHLEQVLNNRQPRAH